VRPEGFEPPNLRSPVQAFAWVRIRSNLQVVMGPAFAWVRGSPSAVEERCSSFGSSSVRDAMSRYRRFFAHLPAGVRSHQAVFGCTSPSGDRWRLFHPVLENATASLGLVLPLGWHWIYTATDGSTRVVDGDSEKVSTERPPCDLPMPPPKLPGLRRTRRVQLWRLLWA
jgi:hypothetical protein